MKKRYENTLILFWLVILLVEAIGGVFYFLFQVTYREYDMLPATVVNPSQLEVILTDKMYEQLVKNNVITLLGKRKKVIVENITRNVLEKDDVVYHQVILKTNTPLHYHFLEVVTIGLYRERKPLITMFFAYGKGEDK